jgi:NADH-quinone oxidoreductase subunit N
MANLFNIKFNVDTFSEYYIYYLQEVIKQVHIFDLPIILKIGILLILINLLFKITAAPFNIWAPGIYEGAPLPVVMFLSIFSKIAVIFFILRFFLVHYYEFLTTWSSVFLLCGIGSMLAAIAGAISEVKIKRFFVYSSMSHVGLMLLALSCANLHGSKAVLIYLIVYTITSLGGWTIIMLLINRVKKIHNKKITHITGLKGLSKNNAVLSFFLAIIMFSMGGIPPLAGFFAKFEVLYALTETELFTYAFVALLLSVISFFYYLRIVKVLYFDPVKKYKLSYKQSQEKAYILSIGFLFTLFFVLYVQQPIFYCLRSVLKVFYEENFFV